MGWGQTASPFGAGAAAGGLRRRGAGCALHHRPAIRGLQEGDPQAPVVEAGMGIGKEDAGLCLVGGGPALLLEPRAGSLLWLSYSPS